MNQTVMSALDFANLDRDFIRTAVFAAFCADKVVSGFGISDTPDIYFHQTDERLVFWTDETDEDDGTGGKKMVAVDQSAPVRVIFKDLKKTIERYQSAQAKIEQLIIRSTTNDSESK